MRPSTLHHRSGSGDREEAAIERPTDPARLTAELAVAGGAGYVGTLALEKVASKLYELEPAADREREDQVRPGDPSRIAAEKISGWLGLRLTESQLDRAGLWFHYGLGVGWALAYPLLRRRGWQPLSAGALTGLSLWVIFDEGVTPAFGFSAPNDAYPLTTHLRAFAAHLAYGLAVMAVTEPAVRLLELTARRPYRPTSARAEARSG